MLVMGQIFRCAAIQQGIGPAVVKPRQDNQLHVGSLLGPLDHRHTGGHHGDPAVPVQIVQQVHGGGAGVNKQNVSLVDLGRGSPGQPPFRLRPQQGAGLEQRHVCLPPELDTAIYLLHHTCFDQICHVRADGIHRNTKCIA